MAAPPEPADSATWSSTLQLIHAARAGEPEPLKALVARFRGRLLERIRLMMGPGAARAAEAEDFLQQSLVEALRAAPKAPLRDDRDFLGWLTHIARNNIRDEVRRKREAAFTEFTSSVLERRRHDTATPSRHAIRNEDQVRIAEALERLPEDYRQVIVLRHFEGLRFGRIAADMGRTEKAIERLHARALLRLHALLGES